MCCSGSIAVPGIGGDRRRQRRRHAAGLLDHGAPVGETRVLVPVGIVDQWIPLRRAPGRSRWLAGERPVGFCDGGIDCGDRGGEVRVGLDDAERLVEIHLVLVSAIIFANVAPLPFLPDALALHSVALPAPAAQAGEPRRGQRPVGLGLGDAAAGAQHGMRPGQLMGRGADVHVGVVEHEVVEVDQLTVEPQAGRGVGEVGAGDKPVADRAFGEPLVEAGERILGGGERAGEFWPRQRIGELGAGCKALITLRGIGQTEASTRFASVIARSRSERSITIDNYRLSIGLDINPQISNSQPSEARPKASAGLRSTRDRTPCQPPSLFRKKQSPPRCGAGRTLAPQPSAAGRQAASISVCGKSPPLNIKGWPRCRAQA